MPEEPNHNRDKLILKDEIQKAYNRLQYDRSVSKSDRPALEAKLKSMESEFEEFFGEEA